MEFRDNQDILFVQGSCSNIIAESFLLTKEDREKVRGFVYATRDYYYVAKILNLIYPNQEGRIFATSHDAENSPLKLEEIRSNKISWPFSKIRRIGYDNLIILDREKLMYSYLTGQVQIDKDHPLLTKKIADVSQFNLSGNYFVVCPYTQNFRGIINEWDRHLYFMEEYETKVVVLNTGTQILKRNKWITDLTNQTTVEESIEILRNAKGFIGCPNFLSVIASKLFDSGLVRIYMNGYLQSYQPLNYIPLAFGNILYKNTEEEADFYVRFQASHS